MKNTLLFICFFSLFGTLSAQFENKNWYFGYGTDGLIFNAANVPVKVNNKYFQVGFEGIVVVSDPWTGQLLFYSDGRKVIDRNHNIMPGGGALLGNYSCGQAAQCCPVPGTCAKKYYLFCNAGYDYSPGAYYYSIVDFTSNPLGIVTNANTVVNAGNTDEANCLITKPNSNDYWLILSVGNSATYKVYPITSSGIGAPVTYTFSNTGWGYQMNYCEVNHKIISAGRGGIKSCTMLDFDPVTGVLSNEQQLWPGPPTVVGGTRFSPDGTKLYAGVNPPATNLFQYDMTTGVWTNMSTCCYAHDLKLGPDGKMYHIRSYSAPQPISVINFPNLTAVGNACNYQQINFPTNFNGEVRRFPEFVTLPEPPHANTDTATLTVAGMVNINVMANDTDMQNDPLVLDSIVYGPIYGTAFIIGGQISYTPPVGFCGLTDTMIYRIKDNNCSFDTAYLYIHINLDTHTNNPQQICSAQTYILNGHVYSTTGTYYDTLTNISGCDSIIITQLTSVSAYNANNPQTLCPGSSYTFMNGHQYSTAGNYTDTIVTSVGCDSIVVTTITINPVYNLNNPVSLCTGQTYSINGHTYSVSGNYVDTLFTVPGCDSIIRTILTVNPLYSINNPRVICSGQNYSFNGHVYFSSGNYYDTLHTILGCDSMFITQLTVNPSYIFSNTQSLCQGQTYLINGHSYNTTGNYSDTLYTFLGCDSIIQTQLTINPIYNLQNIQTICEGQSYVVNSHNYMQTGVYTDILTTSAGCDSIITTNLTVIPVPVIQFTGSPGFCIDAPEVTLSLATPVGGLYSGDGVSGSVFNPQAALVGAHILTYTYTDPVTTCTSTAHETIFVYPLPVPEYSISPRITNLDHPDIFFNDGTKGAVNWKWDFGDSTFSFKKDIAHLYSDTGTYVVTLHIIDYHTCGNMITDTVFIGPSFMFYIPNAFSPNADGRNDNFGGIGTGIHEFSMAIYDRWGNKKYETRDINKPWDGGSLPNGVYIYKINLIDINEQIHDYVGHVSIVK